MPRPNRRVSRPGGFPRIPQAAVADDKVANRPLEAVVLGFPGQVAVALVKDPPSRSEGDWFGRIAQLVEQLTLNQRVQGSSPCAPTNDFNDLARLVSVILTSSQPFILTNVLYSFARHAAFGRHR